MAINGRKIRKIDIIVLFDTRVEIFFLDECEFYRPSEARAINAFVKTKNLRPGVEQYFIVRRELSEL